MKRFLHTAAAILTVATATALAADLNLDGIQCVVADKAANPSKSVNYKKGQVYFCCGGCAGRFEKDTKPYVESANHQLVATRQYEQKACPISGGEVDADVSTKVAGTEVAFCCGGCKARVESVKDPKKAVAMVFSDTAFEKGFQVAKPTEQPAD